MSEHDISDPATGRLRILRERCATCVLRPAGDRIALTNERIRNFVSDAVRNESYVICHSTLYTERERPAICRGFADAYSTNALRIGERLCGFVEIDLQGGDITCSESDLGEVPDGQ